MKKLLLSLLLLVSVLALGCAGQKPEPAAPVTPERVRCYHNALKITLGDDAMRVINGEPLAEVLASSKITPADVVTLAKNLKLCRTLPSQ